MDVIVIPTYNEAENIGDLLDWLLESLPSLSAHIVVVDDASPDGTGDLVRSHDRVVQLDADGSPAPAAVPNLLRALERADIGQLSPALGNPRRSRSRWSSECVASDDGASTLTTDHADSGCVRGGP
jgi:GT2 family glycosyltransferase